MMFNINLLNFSIYESRERKQSHTCLRKIDKIDEKQQKEGKNICKEYGHIHTQKLSFISASQLLLFFFSLSHYV